MPSKGYTLWLGSNTVLFSALYGITTCLGVVIVYNTELPLFWDPFTHNARKVGYEQTTTHYSCSDDNFSVSLGIYDWM